jgi:hypothetical protein
VGRAATSLTDVTTHTDNRGSGYTTRRGSRCSSLFGAAQTVTGSKYVLSIGNKNILLDCGLFKVSRICASATGKTRRSTCQDRRRGLDARAYRSQRVPPVLMKRGYQGPVYCTDATRDLCEILLPDSGHLQEEEAQYLNKHKFARHDPALPLYTREEASKGQVARPGVVRHRLRSRRRPSFPLHAGRSSSVPRGSRSCTTDFAWCSRATSGDSSTPS